MGKNNSIKRVVLLSHIGNNLPLHIDEIIKPETLSYEAPSYGITETILPIDIKSGRELRRERRKKSRN